MKDVFILELENKRLKEEIEILTKNLCYKSCNCGNVYNYRNPAEHLRSCPYRAFIQSIEPDCPAAQFIKSIAP